MEFLNLYAASRTSDSRFATVLRFDRIGQYRISSAPIEGEQPAGLFGTTLVLSTAVTRGGTSQTLVSNIQRFAMRCVKLLAFLSLWACFFACFAFVHLWISILRLPNRWEIISRLTQSFAFLLRTILNIKVTMIGDEVHLQGGGYVIISNHLSYLDGFILGSIAPVVFITYGEVKKWPVIGQWLMVMGTIFINRERKNQVSLLVLEMRRKLKEKANILLFPEGDSTNGERILSFQTVPLAAPLRNRSIIVPATLVYSHIDDEPVSKANRDSIYFYGEMEFLPHFWKVLSLRSINAVVMIHPKIECFRYQDNSAGRKRLAVDCYKRVLRGVGKGAV